MEWDWYLVLKLAGIVIIASVILYTVLPIWRYCVWRVKYFLYNTAYKIFKNEYTKAKRRQFCDQKVIVVNWIQLWYIKDDKHLQIPFFILNSKIWLSHGPTEKQSRDLMEHFTENIKKPTLFIGRLVYYTEADRDDLELMEGIGYELKIWKEESNKVHDKYATYLEEYFIQLSDEEDIDIVTIAHAELNVTHITTDGRNLYCSIWNKHAEIVLIERTEPQDVRTIWIDNSPCTRCSKELVEHFKRESNKPTIYVGKVYEKDPDGMKPLVTSGFTLQPWEEYIKYAGWTVEYSKIVEKIKELINYKYSEEEEVVRLAVDNGRGTVLWINETQVLINPPGGVHAEILLINSLNKSQNRRIIKTIHIENSPCHDCSKALIQYFRYCLLKPTVLVGQIWHRYSEQNDEGLKNMMRAGFKFQVWQAMNDRRHRGDTTTRNYLDSLMHSL